jgi:hypothetical protein
MAPFLAFSCKRRHFCPPCHQKRVVEFGEWLCGHVRKTVPYWHVVLSIPKILRRHFLHGRSLLSELSRCTRESLKTLLEHAVPQDDACLRAQHRQAVPGAVIAIQTFGDFLGFNPHSHILCTDRCFYGNGMFRVVPALKMEHLVFRHNVFKMLLSKGTITEDPVRMLSSWRRSGFNVFCSASILPLHES